MRAVFALHERMRRAVAAALLLLAGCADRGPAELPTESVRAWFPPHGIADTIVVDAADRQALRQAELVAPDGRTTAAANIAVRPQPTFATNQQTGADPYGGTVFGIGNVNPPAAMPVPGGGAPQTETTLSLMLSQADIALPDPVAYRRNWTHYRIRLVFGIPPNTIERDIPAPAPPG